MLGISPDVFVPAVCWAVGGALAVVGAVLIVNLTGLQVQGLALLVVPALAAALVRAEAADERRREAGTTSSARACTCRPVRLTMRIAPTTASAPPDGPVGRRDHVGRDAERGRGSPVLGDGGGGEAEAGVIGDAPSGRR